MKGEGGGSEKALTSQKEEDVVGKLGDHRPFLEGDMRTSCSAGFTANSCSNHALTRLKKQFQDVFQCSPHSRIKFGLCVSSERLCIGLECYSSSIGALV